VGCTKTRRVPSDLPYDLLEPDELLDNLPFLGTKTTEYVKRPETRELHDNPLAYARLLIVGQEASGKTREAAKFAEEAVSAIGRRACIYRMKRIEAPREWPSDIAEHVPILYLDDFDRAFRDERGTVREARQTFRRLTDVVDEYAQRTFGSECWVVATAQQESLERACEDAACARAIKPFERVRLEAIEGETERKYCRSALRAWNVRASDEIVGALAEANAGGLADLYDFAADRSEHRLSGEDVEDFKRLRGQRWARIVQKMPKRQRALLAAMGDLARLGVPLFREYIVELCVARRAEPYAGSRWRWWSEGRRLRQELSALVRRCIKVGPDERLLPHDSRLPEPVQSLEEGAPEGGELLISRACRKELSPGDIVRLREALAGMDEVLYGSDLLPLLELITETRSALSLPDHTTRVQGIRKARTEAGDIGRPLSLDARSEWATAQNNLAVAYCELPVEDRALNLQRAIACYERALEVYTQEAFPAEWAMTQNNLGNAWRNLRSGDRGKNMQNAIDRYKRALEVYTQEAFPAEWAMTQNNLGVAWANLPNGGRGENIQKAIGCFERALVVRTQEAFPGEWALTQNNLGTAWADLPTGEHGQNLQKAIECFGCGLEVRTKQAFPADWAGAQFNMGLAYGKLPEGNRGDNLRRAIQCFENSLTVYTKDTFPDYHGGAQAALARARAALEELEASAD